MWDVAVVDVVITLVGVGHVFDLRRQIREVIAARRPRVVGIELDRVRFVALQNRDTRGDAPVVYRLLSFFQERLAEKYGGRVGEEMLAAADAAKDVGAELALIDRDSSQVFQEVWGNMSFEERVKLLVSAVAGLFITRRRVEKELARFNEDNAAYMDEFAAQFPHVKRVLIDERDAYMARALREIHATRGSVVAVVGDGHVDGLRRQLGDLPLEVIRLKDLRSGQVPPAPAAPPPGPGTSVTFSYEIR
jgi:pheromone shutdown protein TraB